MQKKIFFFLVFLATVYLRNISSAHQLSGKSTPTEIVFSGNKISEHFSYETVSLLDFKNNAEDNNSEEIELALALQQGHATHIP